MAAQQGIKTYSPGRIALKNVVLLSPALGIIGATLNTLACNNNNGLLTKTTSGSNTPTSTPTTGTGALAFVTNFNDGKVSSFTRNLTSGALKLKSQVTAGAKKGPKGVVAASRGSFLYVANNKDNKIYQFSINPTDGTLTPLSPASVSNGSGSGPDEIAINPAGTFLWVTGASNGTVTTYAINSSTGQLTKKSLVNGFTSPFGIVADSTGSFVYVADHVAGLVYSFGIGANGALSQIGPAVPDINGPGGAPAFIAIDPAGTYIYVTDSTAGLVSILGSNAGTLLFGSLQPLSSTNNQPFGIGYASVTGSGNFLFTANQGTSTMWAFPIPNPGFPSSPVPFGAGNLNAPTGLVVDPQNAFLYTTNQNAGTVSQFSLSTTCLGAGAPCFVGNVATESPLNSNSGPFGITLAQ